MGSPFPRMLYRPGTALRVWNTHDVDTLIVNDATEEALALVAGWTNLPGETPQRDPLDHDGDGRRGGSLPGEQSTARRGRRRREINDERLPTRS